MLTITKVNTPTGKVRLNLFCFHWAGSNGTAFKPLGIRLESCNIALYTITLPGRNGRETSTMFKTFPALIIALLTEFCKFHTNNSIGDLPIILFGHSFGGLLAYELKRTLSADDNPRIVIDRVIVSAVRTPMDITENNQDTNRDCHYKQSNADLMGYISRIGGVPEGVDPEIVEFMLPTIRGDYEIIETYNIHDFDPRSPVLDCPLTLFHAQQDATLTAESTSRWEQFTSEEFNVVKFPQGGHFYLTDAATKETFYEKLLEECEKHFFTPVPSCVIS